MKQDIKTLWKNLAANKLNLAVHHIQYTILRAMAAKGEDKVAIAHHLFRKAFSPISNTNKLANGSTPFQVLSNNNASANPYRVLTGDRIGGWEDRQRALLGVPANELLTEEELEEYQRILLSVTPLSVIRRYSYFFTRQDIFDEYQLVQTAHAALELGAKLTPAQVKDLHFTCCGVPDLEALEAVERVLEAMKIPFVTFREPDIGNQKTSIGVYPVEEHRRGILRNYKLLRFNRVQPEAIAEAALEEAI